MRYKEVRNFHHEPINQKYELSEDGQILRNISSKKEFKSLELTFEVEGLSLGAKTLYRRSWGKALPGTEGTSTRGSKAEKGVYKKVKSSTTPSKKHLMSGFAHDQLKELVHKRHSMGTHATQQELFDGKSFYIKIVKHVMDSSIVLLRIECGNWRQGFWFYNIGNQKFETFDKKKHKSGYGDSNILWPELY